jgi:hypothetical protein
MAGRANVRQHTRTTASGRTVRVGRHSRSGRSQHGRGLTPRHAWKLARRALGAARRQKRATAAVLGGLAVAELGAWLTLRGAGLILATAGVLAFAVAAAAMSASGGRGDGWR